MVDEMNCRASLTSTYPWARDEGIYILTPGSYGSSTASTAYSRTKMGRRTQGLPFAGGTDLTPPAGADPCSKSTTQIVWGGILTSEN